MYRSHNCGELNASHINQEVTIAGWVQKSRDKGFMVWVDLRDRYGITQLIFDEQRTDKTVFEKAKSLGREFVIQVKGTVIEREAKNKNMATGDIEILVTEMTLLNAALTPPFTIEDETDGGEDIRMKYRYLDIRRNPVKNSLLFRHKVAMEVRKYLSDLDFCEVETPYLIKSTPEGARDFVVPSRMNAGQFYALPQSPQTFKQLLMVGGMDKYFQIVKCFRDEDLRADRQPEFTQIDCEMAFVEQEDILNVFEGLTRHLLSAIKSIEVEKFPRITYDYAMKTYGNDKPDIRFDMRFHELKNFSEQFLTPPSGVGGLGFQVFDDSEIVLAINVEGCANYTRKQLDELTDWVKRPQVGAKGLVYMRYNEDGTLKSSVDKFFNEAVLKTWAEKCKAKPGDLLLILSGETNKTRTQLSALRMEVATRLGLRKPEVFAPLWVVDFPLLEWDEDSNRFHAMHHPFTSPKPEDIKLLETEPRKVRANAYDMVLNGNEIGGGSIRIHDKELQSKMFSLLGFTPEQAEEQFGFLMNAFQFGAPPHGGLAFGLDRLVAILGGQETIRDFIAFPKNNSGRDVMIDAPSVIDESQLKELNIKLDLKQ
jgi:aspartyl-tRNA synthetase